MILKSYEIISEFYCMVVYQNLPNDITLNIQKMPKNQISSELLNVLKSLFNFLTLLYRLYKPYLKYIFLAAIAYIAFRIGRSNKSVNKLSQILKNRVQFTIHLPQRIKVICRVRKVILGVVLVSAVMWMVVYTFKIRTFRKVKIKFIIIYAIFVVVLLSIAWIYQIFLIKYLEKGRALDMTINQRLYALQKQMGPRAEGLLRIFLCKQTVIKQQKSITRGVCIKDNCKNYRQLLKQKVQRIEILIQNALHFSWCAVCKKKVPFQEFLQFRPEVYLTQNQLAQQEQILKRNQYLFHEISRMIIWMKQLSPCNCSRIYWRQSVKSIKQFKTREKELDQKLIIYQSKSSLKR